MYIYIVVDNRNRRGKVYVFLGHMSTDDYNKKKFIVYTKNTIAFVVDERVDNFINFVDKWKTPLLCPQFLFYPHNRIPQSFVCG